MPRFAVYRNLGRNEDVPFVVQVQSTRLDRSVGRVVVPLPRVGQNGVKDHALTPHLVVLDQVILADVPNVATLPSARLRRSLLVLDESEQDRVVQAIDEMTGRA